VTRSAIAQMIKASGEIDPRVKVNISAHVIGKIERLFVKEGEDIVAGRPFLQLEQEAYIAARDRAAAQLEIARSRQRQSEIDLADAGIRRRRAERLHAESILSQEGLDQAELAYQSAELVSEQAREAVHQAEAELEKARDDLEKTIIYAPLSGRVIALNAEEGEVVVSGTMNNPASVIGTIADLSEILVEVDVDENEIVQAEIGQPASVSVDAVPDHDYRGRVVEIGSSGFQRPQQPDVVFFKVKVLLDDPDERLRAGMSARAEIEVDRHENALTVPIQAVVCRPPEEGSDAASGAKGGQGAQGGGGSGDRGGGAGAAGDPEEIKVVFVERDGKAVQTPVEIGLSDDTRIELLAGVEEGEQVVSGPYRVLREIEAGERIRSKKESAEKKEDRS